MQIINHKICHRIWLFLLFFCLSLPVSSGNASLLRQDLLRIHASIMPKTVFMDYDFKKRLVNGKIAVCILSKQNDIPQARELARYINKLYSNGINGFKITTNVVSYQKFIKSSCPGATIFYILPAGRHIMEQVINKIGKSGIIFTYSPRYLKYGAHVSLKIKYRVKPVINLEALKKSGISLRPALLRISDLYSPDRKL